MLQKLKKIIEYGLYALVFLLPWQTKLILRQTELGRGDWEYGTIALFGTDILLAALLILFLIWSWQEKKSKDKSVALSDRVIIIILSGLDLFIFISIFFAPDTILAIYHYILFLLGIGLFWLVIKTEFDKKKMAVAFFSGLFIQSCLAIGQFLNQGTFAFKWLGLAAHLPADLGASVIETVGADGVGERWLRAYGSLDHPNILGGVLAVGLLILVYIYLRGHFEKDKITNYKLQIINFFTFYFLLLTLFLAFIFTFSRSAWLGFAVGGVLFLIFYILKKDWSALKRLGLAAILAGVLFGAIFFSYQDLFITRAQGTARLEVKSFSERKMYLDDSLQLIKKNWLSGVGIGNYTKALAVKDPKRYWYYLNPVHNVFLLAWSEIGILGALFFVALLVYLFIQSFRQKNILNLSILSILVIIMMFDHYLWSLHFGILFFWILIGLVYKSLNKNKDKN